MKSNYPHNLVRRIYLSLIVEFIAATCLYSQPKLIGVAGGGGQNNAGFIYEYDIKTNSFHKKFDFTFTLSTGTGSNGFLIQAGNGKIYGTEAYLGLYDQGILFEFDLAANKYIKKADFDGAITGSNPIGSLVQAPNGKLYGVTAFGGVNEEGVIFEYDITTNALKKVMDFDGTNGRNPSGGLILGSNGKLYGVTRSGGENNNGLLFEYDAMKGNFVRKYSFDQTFPVNSEPIGNLVQTPGGKLYGLRGGYGLPPWQSIPGSILFMYDLSSNTYEEKHSFEFGEGSSLNARSGLIYASNGKLYGIGNGPFPMDFSSGFFLNDVLFEYNISNDQFQIVMLLEGSEYMPTASQIMQTSDGVLYGVSSGEGLNNKGVLFEFKPATGIYTEKLHFDIVDGESPFGRLLELGVVSGISEFESVQSEFNLFPNPTRGVIFIYCEKGEGKLSIINSLGQTLVQQRISNTKTEFDLSKFDEGIYYIRLQLKERIEIKKIVKQ